MKEIPLYDTVVLSPDPRKDAAGQMRPNTRDLICQEVVRQVLAKSPAEQARIKEMLGSPHKPAPWLAVRTT